MGIRKDEGKANSDILKKEKKKGKDIGGMKTFE